MLKEKQLINDCVKGNLKAQKALYERFSGKMFVICKRYARDEQEAKEIMLDAFLKVFDNLSNFRQECPLEAWIHRIMVNTAIKYYKKRNKLHPVVEVEEITEKFVESDIMPQFGYEELLGMIKQLPDRYSSVFNLYVLDGYSHQEISEMLNIPEGTSKSNLSRARVMLQEMIRRKDEILEKKIAEITIK